MLNPKIDYTHLFFAAARLGTIGVAAFDYHMRDAEIVAIVNAAYEMGRNSDDRYEDGEKTGERCASYEIDDLRETVVELRADVDRLEDELSAEYNRGYEDGKKAAQGADLLAQIRALVGVETDAVAAKEFAAGYDEGYGRGGADALDLVTKTLGTPDEIQAKILAAHSEGYALGLEAGYQDGYDDGREASEWTHFGPKDAE